MAYVERVIGVNARCEEIDSRPEEGGDHNHGFSRKPVAQPPSDWRGAHVGDHEPECERPDLLVGDQELAFDLLLNAGQNVAVDVVDEV